MLWISQKRATCHNDIFMVNVVETRSSSDLSGPFLIHFEVFYTFFGNVHFSHMFDANLPKDAFLELDCCWNQDVNSNRKSTGSKNHHFLCCKKCWTATKILVLLVTPWFIWNFKLVRIKLKFQILEADWLQLSSSFQSLRNLISHYYPLQIISMSHAALMHVTCSCNRTNISEMN